MLFILFKKINRLNLKLVISIKPFINDTFPFRMFFDKSKNIRTIGKKFLAAFFNIVQCFSTTAAAAPVPASSGSASVCIKAI